jgi:hypothetical protein
MREATQLFLVLSYVRCVVNTRTSSKHLKDGLSSAAPAESTMAVPDLGPDWDLLTQWATAPINLDRQGGARTLASWVQRIEGTTKKYMGYLHEMGYELPLADALANGQRIFDFVFCLVDHR